MGSWLSSTARTNSLAEHGKSAYALGWNPAGCWGCKRMRGAAVKVDAIGEQQPKRTRSGAAVEADASGEHAAAAEAGAIGQQHLEADANGKQQMKRMQSGQGSGAAEADASDEQHLKRTQSRASGRNRALHRALSGAGLLAHGRRTRGK